MVLGLGLWADFGSLGEELRSFRWELFPLALALTALNYLLRFFRWHRYLARLEIEIPPGRSFTIFVAGLTMTITPAKLGELLKSGLLKRDFDVPVRRSAPVVFAERVTDATGVVVLAVVGGAGTRNWPLLLAAVVAVAGALSFLPGGLGVAEPSMAALIKALGDATKAQAAAATLLIRLSTLWFAVALGLIGLAVEERLYRRQPVRRSSMR